MQITKIEFKTNKHHQLILADNIKEKSGVYIIYDKFSEAIYVGQTKNFRPRMHMHINYNTTALMKSKRQIPVGKCAYYSFIEIDNSFDKDLFELILIRYLRPKYNKEFNHGK